MRTSTIATFLSLTFANARAEDQFPSDKGIPPVAEMKEQNIHAPSPVLDKQPLKRQQQQNNALRGASRKTSAISSQIFNKHDVTRNMLNGVEVNPPLKYPFMVYGGGCGASLIAPNVLLSAAHCKDFINQVQIGRHNLADGTEVYESFSILEKVTHPLYDANGFDYDYMVLKLNGKSTATPVELDNGEASLSPGSEAIVMGWGGTTILQELEVLVYSTSVCEQIWDTSILDPTLDRITDRNFCAAPESSSQGPCNGDSGGPLIDKATGKQIGIVSFGSDDCSTNPTVYAKIQDQISFINEYINKWDDTPRPTCTDYPGWTDERGNGCAWFQVNDQPECPIWAGCGDFCTWPNGTPHEACCYCGGGIREGSPTAAPVPGPVSDPTPAPVSNPTPSPVPDPTPAPVPNPTLAPDSGDCSVYTSNTSCNSSEGCAWIGRQSICATALPTSTCSQWDGNRRGCKNQACKWWKQQSKCIGRWG